MNGPKSDVGYYEDAAALGERLGMPVAPKDEAMKFLAKTPARLAEVVSGRMTLLGLGEDDVSRMSGVDANVIAAIAGDGRASLLDIYATLEALNLRAVCLPWPWEAC